MATRTWVSGVGDDVNPCSRTAPCKTFAGAISKTAAAGEIDALDPGGFGALTITKAITLDGGIGSGWASILAAATNGIIINAGVGAIVTLRNLSINGAGTGICGIRIIGAGRVFIENCEIFGFGATAGASAGIGIRDERTTGGTLFVTGTTIRSNIGSAIVVLPSSAAPRITAAVDNCWLQGNGNAGIIVSGGSLVTVSNSIITGNLNFGIFADQPFGTTECNVEGCVIAHNGTGVRTSNGTPTVRLSDSTIVGNTVGIQVTSGTVATYTNNRINANGSGNAPSAGAAIPLR